MSLIFFDGMDQYVPVPMPTTTKNVHATVAVANLTTVATDPTPMFMDSNTTTFARNAGEDRVYRVPGKFGTQVPGGSYGMAQTRITAPWSSIGNNGYGLALDFIQPVSACQSITLGYKLKYASNMAPNTQNGSILLGAFSSDSTFFNTTTTFGIVMEANQRVVVRPIYQSDPSVSMISGAFPANTFTDTTDGFIGTCNLVYGSSNSVTTIPALDQLAANTIEIQYTVGGKISVWVNNMFAGTAQFANPATYTGIRHAKIGCAAQAASFGNGITLYGFTGVSDLYMLNGLGTKNTSRLGKVKVVSRAPQADATVQFVRPDTANSNSSVVSQSPVLIAPALIGTKVGDTDLYSSSAFNFTNEAIIATAISTTGYKTDPSGNDIAPVLNVQGTNYTGSNNTLPISTSLMKTDQHIYELNPKTGLPFTKSELDATTFGVTVVAP